MDESQPGVEPQQDQRSVVPSGRAPADGRPDPQVGPTPDATPPPSAPEESESTTKPEPAPTGSKFRIPKGLLPALIFAVVGLVTAVAATGVYLYDKSTEPDRSTPIVSTDAFLHAVFVERSQEKTALFVCDRLSAEKATSSLTTKIDPTLSVTWGNFLDLPAASDQAKVRVQIRLSAGGSTDIQRWEFTVIQESGWRVCDARYLGPLRQTRPG